MRNFKLLLVFVAVFATLQASALSRDCNLTVKVVTATGESLEGQRVMLVQTDYSMTYGASETTLDAAGECRLKVYSGNHRLTVERAGYAAYAEDFPVTGDMTLNVTLTEDVRNPFALKLAERHDPMTGKNDVTLQWNREDPVFFDDFESYTAFDTEFSPWTGIDGDHAAAAPLQGSYPNRGTLQYAQVINPLVVEPSWWTDYPVLRPYGGKQYVGFVRTYGGSANDDWLISPAVTASSSFWAAMNGRMALHRISIRSVSRWASLRSTTLRRLTLRSSRRAIMRLWATKSGRLRSIRLPTMRARRCA